MTVDISGIPIHELGKARKNRYKRKVCPTVGRPSFYICFFDLALMLPLTVNCLGDLITLSAIIKAYNS